MTRQKYFYYIIFMLMASAFLTLVFNNLPSIIKSHHIWTTIWVISLLLLKPKVFLDKMMLYILGYGILLYIATLTIWSNIDIWNYKMLLTEFYEIAIGASVITYFRQNKDYTGLAQITKWAIVFFIITAIMTIVSAIIDPMYARNITGVAAVIGENERNVILSFKRYGGGTYSTAIAFMALLPIYIYYYKNIEISLLSKRQIIVLSIITFLALLGMQLFSNILIAVVFSILALSSTRKIKRTVFIILLLVSIIFIIPKGVYTNGLYSISNLFSTDSDLNYKFRDLANFVESDADIENSNTGTSSRIERYPMLMNTFLKSPLFGCYFLTDESGNGYEGEGIHLHWMNKLTTTGIIGLLFFLYIPYRFIKNNLQYFNSTYKFFYILANLTILIYGLMKTIVGRETWYTFFIILPGLYYLPLLKKNKTGTI